MEILVIVALVVVAGSVALRQWCRGRGGKVSHADMDGTEGKTQQMNDMHGERTQREE